MSPTRLFDAAVAFAGLVVLSPVLVLLALLVKASSRGPVLFRAERVGRGGRPFFLYKFRSMRVGGASGAKITTRDDPRVTGVGRFLRRYRLDELPQLWNVLRGDMSLVGPRPEDPRYVALYTAEQRRLLSVRPGVTGAAALEYLDEEALLSGPDWEDVYVRKILPAKLAIELAYLDRRSFGSDLALLARTAGRLFGGRAR